MVFVKYSHLFCFSLSVTKNRREKKKRKCINLPVQRYWKRRGGKRRDNWKQKCFFFNRRCSIFVLFWLDWYTNQISIFSNSLACCAKLTAYIFPSKLFIKRKKEKEKLIETWKFRLLLILIQFISYVYCYTIGCC